MTNTPDKSEMKACDAQSPLSKDDPRIIAWDAYRATRDYKNTRNWALHDAHVDGSLWAAFIAGWSASSRPPADQVPDMVEAAAAIIFAYKPLGMPQLLPPDAHEAGLKRAAETLAALKASGEE